ncbi:PQQ-binding-like beta-propeller repeat protein, partial [bacterium]|nr:PQQ-binding-like beta-propeller repeat protein [bacterium]
IWKETMYSTVGSLAVDETGGTIVLAAYGHGLLRFDAKGRREGTYHIEHTPNLVAVEIDGSRLLAASIDGYLTAFDYEGTVLFDRKIGDKASALAMDALGRFAVLGFESGEVRFLSRDSLSLGATALTQDGTDLAAYVLRSDTTAGEEDASWQSEIAPTSDEGASAVLCAVGMSGQIAVYTTRKTLRIYDAAGQCVHESPRIDGVGRTLHSNDITLIAASDRRLISYDPASRSSILASNDLYDISHFFATSQVNEAIVVESCDQIRRMRLPGVTHWKHRLPMRISSIAVDSIDRIAMVLEDHQLVIVDAAGKPIGRYRNRKPVPMIVAEIENGWVTASLGEQLLRGHSTDGKVIWEESLAWDPWSLQHVAEHLVVTSSDGRSMLVTPTGEVIAESQELREGAIYFPLTPNVVGRIYLSGMAVIVSNFEGKLLWRRSLPDRPTSFTARGQVFWGVVGRGLLSFSLPKTERITP